MYDYILYIIIYYIYSNYRFCRIEIATMFNKADCNDYVKDFKQRKYTGTLGHLTFIIIKV